MEGYMHACMIAFQGQHLPRTHLAQHELKSVIVVVIIMLSWRVGWGWGWGEGQGCLLRRPVEVKQHEACVQFCPAPWRHRDQQSRQINSNFGCKLRTWLFTAQLRTRPAAVTSHTITKLMMAAAVRV